MGAWRGEGPRARSETVDMLFAISVAVAALLAVLFVVSNRTRRNHPPGPRGLPFIGQARMEVVRKERSFLKWSKQYGPIFQYTFFGETAVVLSDPELIREAFARPSTANRITNEVMTLFYADCGLTFSSGAVWHQTRRFTLHHLRNLGMGKSKLEGVIQDQISGFLNDVVAPSEGKALSFDSNLKIAVANIIWGTVSSERFSIGDTRALEVMTSFDEVGKHTWVFVSLSLFPMLKKLPGRLTGLDRLIELFHTPIDRLLQPAIDEHERTVDLAGEPRDYIDCFLQERKRNPDLFTNRHLLRSILDLFVAGYDTTTSTLLWAFCFLCSHPDVQQRLRAEIKAMVGSDRPPELADRPRMPYTEAFLMETQRLANIAPYGVEHVTSEEFQLAGYTVPKGAQVISLLMAVHLDEKLFPEADQFRPERFLDADGKVKPSRWLMPFSTGRRACLGEAMARAELFLFVTGVLQRFKLRFPDGFRHDFSCWEHKFLIREPTPFQIIAETD